MCKMKLRLRIIDIQLFEALKVPGAGIEPARIAPLVFETSASTDSAIWACLTSQMRCKDTAFF